MGKANEISEASETTRVNAVSELKDLMAEPVTKYRLDEINNIKEYFNTEIKEKNDIIKKILLLLIMLTKFLLHYLHRLAL